MKCGWDDRQTKGWHEDLSPIRSQPGIEPPGPALVARNPRAPTTAGVLGDRSFPPRGPRGEQRLWNGRRCLSRFAVILRIPNRGVASRSGVGLRCAGFVWARGAADIGMFF